LLGFGFAHVSWSRFPGRFAAIARDLAQPSLRDASEPKKSKIARVVWSDALRT
jgi:hypothetical protein